MKIWCYISNVLTFVELINISNNIQFRDFERFNRIYRTKVLDLSLFNNLEQARRMIEQWLTIYNTQKPHKTLNNMAPIKYKTQKQVT
ncbi:integrase core domain-containing protein [Gilliamella sp. Nev3-1]|jgi:putative transposase|uniref:integrase core domain-containing protein n=1 Tax=Gilliamella sp. Nev3-1 TaxID=3120250 RepID=UPI00080DD4CF|nr:integrase core domain-containing protein [Gilliamella apicola]OCG60934.1 hypothetical protein A9G40_02350 [Gilliamella apicola]